MKDLLERMEEFRVIHVSKQNKRITDVMINLAMKMMLNEKFLINLARRYMILWWLNLNQLDNITTRINFYFTLMFSFWKKLSTFNYRAWVFEFFFFFFLIINFLTWSHNLVAASNLTLMGADTLIRVYHEKEL